MSNRKWPALFAALLFVAGNACADRGPGGDMLHRHMDVRHGHNQAYFDRGFVVRSVPREAAVVRFGADRYWFHGGVWYRPRGGRFVVVAPPIGIFVPVLPPFFVSLTFGGIPYYYANETYYVSRGSAGYEVVAPPPGAEAAVGTTAAPAGENIFIYPKNGQPPEQQAKDRYECHRWAADQTGFDPTRGDANLPPEVAATRRGDYSRAMNACLDARGYSVR